MNHQQEQQEHSNQGEDEKEHYLGKDGAAEETLAETEEATFDNEGYENQLTYAEIMSNLTLNDEIVITVLSTEVERIKTGLKNLKAKQAARMKLAGTPIPEEILEFTDSLSEEFQGCTRMHIVLRRRGTVRIMKLEIPSGEY